MSLKQRLLVFVAALLVTVVVALSGVMYWQMRTEVIDIVRQEIKTTASGNREIMTKWITHRREAIEAVAARLPLVDAPAPLLLEGRKVGKFDQVYIGYEDKRMDYDLPEKTPVPGFDPTERLWYKQANETKSTVITQPYVSVRTKELCITVSRSVASQTPSVVAGDISLEEIIQLVNAIELRGRGYAFLSTRDGKIVAHSKLGSSLKPVEDIIPGFDTSFLKTADGNIGLHKFGIEGTPKYAATVAIPGTDWALCIVADKAAALSPLCTLLRNMAISGLIIAALGTLIAYPALLKLLKLSPESCRTEAENQ
ncbi:MAG: cache domain-containing protein [Azoarcus sp.]|jgi:methyl-accepting chemotaxis protein|nr:cache domain-containing protein [Azoarcus sp.]